jgi:hypothetical protein
VNPNQLPDIHESKLWHIYIISNPYWDHEEWMKKVQGKPTFLRLEKHKE